MNKHINKKCLTTVTVQQAQGLLASIPGTQSVTLGALVRRPDPNLRLLEVDHMPVEVARELLLKPCACQTNSQRKTCMEALYKRYESTRQPVKMEVHMEAKMKAATWEQLCKWLKRVIARRKDTQAKVGIVQRQLDKVQDDDKQKVRKLALLNLAMSKLNLRGAQLDLAWEVIEAEVDRRRTFCASVTNIAPQVGQSMRQKLCPTTS